ncbi:MULTISPECIES: hypothetical protein [Dechloromonas]|uniref:Uncharacterized protein n=1 Tax=Dechloromonas denitrificans TaxID=281362 RepID=A0A133XGK9_9RHOO|nr:MULTISPECIES: hypothetical protein [Dechloromonas]KXB30085.1 hypothetical protein AT959_11955 [Dechloromonas denitrificans]
MKQAKKRTTYPNASMSPETDAIIDAEIEQQGYSNNPQAMKEFGDYLTRALNFERKRRHGK